MKLKKKKSKKEKLRTPFNILFLILTAIVGIWILFPYINYANTFSINLQGKELFIFNETLNKYKHYDDKWTDGPLMPYYYASLFKIFNISIQTALFGKILLIFLSGLTIYFICTSFTPPYLATTAAIYYWTFLNHFEYSFSIEGGITCILFSILTLFRFSKEHTRGWILIGFISLILIFLMNIKIGLITLILYTATAIIIDQRTTKLTFKRLSSFLLLALTTIVIYGFLHVHLIGKTEISLSPKPSTCFKVMSLAYPIIIMLIFHIIGLGIRKIKLKNFFITFFCMLAICQIIQTHQKISSYKIKENKLLLANSEIFINPKNKQWLKNLSETIIFMKQNIDKKEKFQTLPFNGLYYFFSRKPLSEKYNWIILSNNSEIINSNSELSKQIESNYKVSAEFGNWSKSPNEEYATRILKQK